MLEKQCLKYIYDYPTSEKNTNGGWWEILRINDITTELQDGREDIYSRASSMSPALLE